MKVTIPVNWLSKSLFQVDKLGNPITLTISGYVEEKGAKGINRRIAGVHSNGLTYEFDIFGDVLQEIVSKLGDDSDKWKGATLRVMLVMRGDKEIKKVQVLP